MRLDTTIIGFCGYAAQNGFSSRETLEDYLGKVVSAIEDLELGEEIELDRLNTRQCARHSILEDIYIEILTHTRYLNNLLGTKGMKWDYKWEDLPQEEKTMFQEKSFIVYRVK